MSELYTFDRLAADGRLVAANKPAQTTIQISADDLNLGSNPPTKVDSSTIGNLLGIAYFLAGIVAVIVIIIGGIRYAAANGDSSQIQAAKNMITYAVVGLVVVVAASAITQFVLAQITK